MVGGLVERDGDRVCARPLIPLSLIWRPVEEWSGGMIGSKRSFGSVMFCKSFSALILSR